MRTEPSASARRVLVMGASGYVGSRLVPRLARKGHAVRAASRSLGTLKTRPWAADPRVELVEADAFDPASLARAMADREVVYYLVHSMGGKRRGFAEADRRAARNVADAARAAGVRRIVYLGGLGEGPRLSEHLRSRHEVGDVLRAGGVPVTEFRAAVILGAGSASFEILRYLTDRLPVMVSPRWVSTPVQPIAIRDVLGYLVDCLDAPATVGETFEIGGPEVLTYRALMDLYAEEAGLRRRLIVGVPVLTPRLSSYWIHLVTPAPASIARPLAEGLRNPVVVRDDRIRALLPRELTTCRDAIRLALAPRQHSPDALPASAWSAPGDARWTGGTVLEDVRAMTVPAPPSEAWAPIARLGGHVGYYYGNWLWGLRGALDRLVGGVGMRRSKVARTPLRPGDPLDFWRVEAVEPGERLRLVAEMRLPGEASLEFRVRPTPEGTRIEQAARFRPRGLAGIAYWHALHPLHALVFRGMLRGIGREATRTGH